MFETVHGGWSGAGSALLGTACGAGVFLMFYLLGGMGGGDVKLMAGFGAVLGSQLLFEAALWTAGCGGLMAVLFLAAHYLRGVWTEPERDSETSESCWGRATSGSHSLRSGDRGGVWLAWSQSHERRTMGARTWKAGREREIWIVDF